MSGGLGSARPDGPSVLVLGAGFIGSAVAGALVQRDCLPIVFTRSDPAEQRRSQLAGASVVVGDTADMGTLAAALNGVDQVVYAIGSSSPIESDLDPAADVAIVVPPLVRLLELLRLRPGVRLTFLSSGGAVYGEAIPPVDETARPRPISSYGIIKVTCEQYIHMYADAHGVPAQILRIGNAYGPGQPVSRGQGVVARLVRSAVTGELMPLYGGLDSVRDYIYIDDVAGAIADLARIDSHERVLNIGTGIGHPLHEVLSLACEVTGRDIPTRNLGARSFDVSANILDVSRLTKLVPFAPLDLRTGLTRVWADANASPEAMTLPENPPHAPGMQPH